eukprot:NODE_4726_length_646_cov_170.253807.p2 GENE.NODE_4726_length_646_cov_170.253807~~NODE_4726_length_646_cov_170.253807.p2  ORF type:complete len:146 (+),score=83.47 NODE_4726_length_646_cov_170.253807:43-438(+)
MVFFFFFFFFFFFSEAQCLSRGGVSGQLHSPACLERLGMPLTVVHPVDLVALAEGRPRLVPHDHGVGLSLPLLREARLALEERGHVVVAVADGGVLWPQAGFPDAQRLRMHLQRLLVLALRLVRDGDVAAR